MMQNYLEWLKNIQQKLGRPLRVLHIGNIANNAYLNSKLLRELDVESDVLSYDYYHVMGCPEWEEIFFEDKSIHHNAPDWSKVNQEYRRPSWFIQGRFITCMHYMRANQNGWGLLKKLFWCKLGLENQTVSFNPLAIFFIVTISAMASFWFRFGMKASDYLSQEPQVDGLQRIGVNLKRRVVPRSFKGYVKFIIFFLFCVLTEILKWFLSFEGFRTKDLPFEQVSSAMVEKFLQRFPKRADQLIPLDISHYFGGAKYLSGVLDYYDVIHCYSTDVRWPIMIGKENYVAYEHGTIRTLPFNDTPLSRLVALGYGSTPLIYMTNADSVKQAQILKAPQSRILFGLHGFDERLVHERLRHANRHRTRKDGRFGFADDIKVFLQAARQDWKIKGNEHVFHAIHQLKQKGINGFVVVMTEWGKDLERAKNLAKELEIESYIHWTSILSKTNLLHTYACVDGVIDQFVCPCIGAVAAEVLCIGHAPFITLLDDVAMARFYGETIPCFNCGTAEEISNAISSIIQDPITAATRVERSKAWFEKIHKHEKVQELCLAAYKEVLS